MKKSYLLVLFASLLSFNIQASPQTDFAAALKEQTTTAFNEIHAQMAIQINLSGKQRMLTQKMSKESLLISNGIDAEKNRENLQSSMELFEKTLTGLAQGDESLELVKTTEPEILEQLEKVQTLWNDFKPDIEAIIAGKTDKGLLENIAKNNLPLLSEMNKAVKMYELYSGANLNDSARVINLSGKQRMLTQKMTKELLLIASDIDVENNKSNLTETTALFEKTLAGLAKGDDELGLPETHDEKILAQLTVVKEHWDTFKPIVESQDTSAKNLEEAAKLNLPLLKEMNTAVKMFEQASGN